MNPARSQPRKAGLLALIAILYFTVSGGPFGLESAVGAIGVVRVLALLFIVPIVWGLPTALMVAELSAALPCEGGFYLWVDRALGRFWGFQEAWWSWVCELPDMAIYPVLFTGYVSQWVQLSPAQKWLLSLAVIWSAAALNLLGIEAVGATAALSGIFIIVPFLAFSALAMRIPLPDGAWHAMGSQASGAPTSKAGWLVGLSIILFNYTGWDNLSLVGDEVENPQRNYPIALLGGLALITLMYVLPVVGGYHIAPNPAAWSEGVFPTLARMLPGGRVLGAWLLAGALISAFVQFNSLLLSNTRLPMVLASDGYFPKFLAKTNSRGVPAASIVLSSVGYSIFALMGYEKLVVLYVLVYTLSVVLEFLALWVLRVREPDLPRPFRVPGGIIGLALTVITPLIVGTIVLVFTFREGWREPRWLICAGVAALSGLPAWLIARKRRTPAGQL